MSVILLTILISSCLAAIFIVCFAAEVLCSRNGSPERDSLLPLDEHSPSRSRTDAAQPSDFKP